MNDLEKNTIPEPPDEKATPEELSAYYEQYSPQELVGAGYMSVLPSDDIRAVQHQAAASTLRAKRKRAQLNIVFNEEELSELDEYAKAIHIPVSTIAKSWILRALKTEKTRLSETRI